MTRRRHLRWPALAAGVLLWGGGTVAPALAADASGCSGSAVSIDSGGHPVDKVTAPGAGGTRDQPFVVDLNGSIAWKGSTPVALKDGSWSVTLGGLPVRSGDVSEDQSVTTKSGTTDLSEIPAFASAFLDGKTVVPVVVDINAANGTCSATVYVSTATSPTFTPLWITGTVMLIIGVMLLIFLLVRILATPTEAGYIKTVKDLDEMPSVGGGSAS